MSNPEFVYKTYIKSTPEKVWQAITNPAFTTQYWGAHDMISDWKKGSKWKLVATDNGSDVKCIGEVIESVPPRLLVLSWIDPQNTADVSRVTFEIEAFADTVTLSVIHGDFTPGTDMVSKISQGWPRVLSNLKTLLETGNAVDVWTNKGGCAKSAA